jgi:hypothetical protein
VSRLIVPHNWKQFQHADTIKRGHAPRWIKNYTALTSDDDYLALSGHRRAILHGLWLEYAKSGGRLRENTAMISSRLNLKVTRRDLEALNQAGFLDFCQDNVTTLSSLRGEETRQDPVTRAVDVSADERPKTYDEILKEIA